MKNSTPTESDGWCNHIPLFGRKKYALDTLSGFVRDTEHELLSVITALQAHLDLMYDNQVRNKQDISRFPVINRSLTRLITDTNVLLAVSELAKGKRNKQKHLLTKLLHEIVAETEPEFKTHQVNLACDITAGTTIVGNAAPLKQMITKLLLTILDKCEKQETLTLTSQTKRRRLKLSFSAGLIATGGIFKPWDLGQLRLMPLNGEGIALSAVDAMARLQNGQLAVKTQENQHQTFQLMLQV